MRSLIERRRAPTDTAQARRADLKARMRRALIRVRPQRSTAEPLAILTHLGLDPEPGSGAIEDASCCPTPRVSAAGFDVTLVLPSLRR